LTNNKKSSSYLSGLELLRFLAAAIILIWHYQHFYLTNVLNIYSFNINNQPFYNFLFPFYNYGYLAVNFFWCLSGFIFYYKYSNLIVNKNCSFKNFFIDRFSRLYPLHIFTLILVAAFQFFFFLDNNYYFIYKNNDFYHFILSIFFISSWGFESSISFNGPIWSVSTEIFVYFFFYISLFTFRKPILLSLLVLLFCAIFKLCYPLSVYNFFAFFYIGYFFSIIFLYKKFYKFYIDLLIYIFLFIFILTICKYELYLIKHSFFVIQIIFFPILIYFFSSKIISNNIFIKKISFLGNLTYSSYLMHFPVQLITVFFLKKFNVEVSYEKNLFFIFYFFGVILLAYFVYFYFEKPSKNYIREKYNY
jgi:peptidoglycan/LPS O-acetylase OafA/YrhL